MLSIWTNLKFCSLVKNELSVKKQNVRLLLQIESVYIQQNRCDRKNEIYFVKGTKNYFGKRNQEQLMWVPMLGCGVLDK